MTTNGISLKDKLTSLINAGMDGVNISLDTLEKEKYAYLTGFDCFDKAIEAVDAACESGIKVKINTVVLKENIDECTQIVELAKDRPIDVRFIELMPIGEGKNYSSISCGEVFERLKKVYPNIYPETSDGLTGPAVYYGIDGFKGKIGFINAVHNMFCESCNRIRLTSDGFLKTCLCYDSGVMLKNILEGRQRYTSVYGESNLSKTGKSIVLKIKRKLPKKEVCRVSAVIFCYKIKGGNGCEKIFGEPAAEYFCFWQDL